LVIVRGSPNADERYAFRGEPAHELRHTQLFTRSLVAGHEAQLQGVAFAA
jgi:hypothetical protein